MNKRETQFRLTQEWFDESDQFHSVVCFNPELTIELNKGNYDALDNAAPEDYILQKYSYSSRKKISGPPTSWQPQGNFSISFSVPPEKSSYVCIHAFRCTDLQALNKRIGTNYKGQVRVKSHSSEVLVSAGSVSSNKVRDFSSIDALANIDTSLVPMSTTSLEALSPIKEFSVSINAEPAAETGDKTSSFIFDLDIENVLARSPLGSIFSRPLSSGVRGEILSMAQILSMEMVRKRIDIPNGEEKKILSSSQKNTGSPLKQTVSSNRERNNVDGTILGSISETNTQSATNLRTFTGKDLSLPSSDSDGEYEYKIKLRVKDGIVSYLSKKLSTLESSVNTARSWSNDISFGRPVNNSKIFAAIANYSEIAGEVFGVASSKKIVDTIFPMIGSSTGDLATIESVISAMESLVNKMNNLLGAHIPPRQGNTGKGKTAGYGKGAKGIIEIEKTFSNETLKVSDSDAGYVFIESKNTNFGVNTITRTGLQGRFDRELDAFSDSKSPSVPSDIAEAGILSDTKVSALTDLSSTSTSYLTPSSVVVDGQSIDVSSATAKWDPEQSSGVVDTIRDRKQTMAASLKSLSAFGITCEVFGAKQRKKEGSGTFAVDSANDMQKIFEETDGFTSKNIEPDLNSRTEEKETEATNDITSAISPSVIGTPSINDQPGMQLSSFDPSSTDSLVKDLGLSDIQRLPLQIKSLMLSRSPNTKKNWLDDDNSSLVTDLGFNIAQIEVLSYGDGKTPQWKTLTPSIFSRSKDRTLRCRIKNYSNSNLGIGLEKEELKLTIFDNQFLIEGDSGTAVNLRSKENATPARMENYLSSLDEERCAADSPTNGQSSPERSPASGRDQSSTDRSTASGRGQSSTDRSTASSNIAPVANTTNYGTMG